MPKQTNKLAYAQEAKRAKKAHADIKQRRPITKGRLVAKCQVKQFIKDTIRGNPKTLYSWTGKASRTSGEPTVALKGLLKSLYKVDPSLLDDDRTYSDIVTYNNRLRAATITHKTFSEPADAQVAARLKKTALLRAAQLRYKAEHNTTDLPRYLWTSRYLAPLPQFGKQGTKFLNEADTQHNLAEDGDTDNDTMINGAAFCLKELRDAITHCRQHMDAISYVNQQAYPQPTPDLRCLEPVIIIDDLPAHVPLQDDQLMENSESYQATPATYMEDGIPEEGWLRTLPEAGRFCISAQQAATRKVRNALNLLDNKRVYAQGPFELLPAPVTSECYTRAEMDTLEDLYTDIQ